MTSSQNARDQGATTNYVLVLILWVAGLTSAAQFSKISIIFDEFAAIYPNAGTQIGLMLSLISFMGILFGLYAGVLVSRLGLKRMLIAALLFGALMSLFQTMMPRFEIMLISRIIEGLSHLAIVVAAPTLIAKYSAPSHANITMTLWSTFFGVAFVFTTWLGLPLVEQAGIAALFFAHAVIMVTIALSLIILLPQDQSVDNTDKDKKSLSVQKIIAAHLEIYRSPFLSAPAFGWLSYTLTYVSLITVLPSQVPEAYRTLIVGFLPMFGIVTSLFCGLVILKYISAVRVVMASFIAASLILCLYFLNVSIIAITFAIFGLLGFVQSSSFSAVTQIIKDTESRAKANGAMAQMGNLGNTVGTPLLLIVLSHSGLAGMIIAVILFYLFGAAAHFVLERKRRKLSGG